MSEAEQTPGPWQTRFIYRMIRRVRESPGDLLLLSGSPEQDWADASLMAAAPDLLAACADALRIIVHEGYWNEALQLETAISKATGSEEA